MLGASAGQSLHCYSDYIHRAINYSREDILGISRLKLPAGNQPYGLKASCADRFTVDTSKPSQSNGIYWSDSDGPASTVAGDVRLSSV
jgi:hypothetical protein